MGADDVWILLLDAYKEHTEHCSFVRKRLHSCAVAASSFDFRHEVVGEGGGVAAAAALTQLAHQGEATHVLWLHVSVSVSVHLGDRW